MSRLGQEHLRGQSRGWDIVHATCIVVGEAGILIRGESGAGKSTLARSVVEIACRSGHFACLVSDDRTRIAERHGRLVAQVVPSIAGRIEARGAGILTVAYETSAVVRLVVDLGTTDPPRLPASDDQTIVVCGVAIPRLRQRGGASSASLVLRHVDGGPSGARID
jgi:serine kinase of HPr protein (carbohydrate metabolism regulator)